MDDKTPIFVIKLAGLMFVATLGAMVAMAVAGHETASIERIVGPLLSSVIVVGVVGAITQAQNGKLDEQSQELTTIKEQTNGVLDRRIAEGTKAAMRELLAEETASTSAKHRPPEPAILESDVTPRGHGGDVTQERLDRE